MVEKDRFEIKIWPLWFDLKFRYAPILSDGMSLDIRIPIFVCAKSDSPAIRRIKNANQLFMHSSLLLHHDRIDTTSSCSSRAISLRPPDGIFGTEKEQFDRISHLKKRLRKCGTRVMSRQ